jgi:hypothetical protein
MGHYSFLLPLVLLALSVAANAADKEGMSLKDDYQALQSPQGLWTKDSGRGKRELHFEGKEFPKLQLTITDLVPGKKDFDTGESFKVVNVTLQENAGKRVLVIEGKSFDYAFEGNRRFLVLKGAFEHKNKTINLTGKWGQSRKG